MGWGYTLAVTVNQASLTVFRGDLGYSCKGLNDCVSPQANTETLTLNVMISQSASFGRKIAAALINERSVSVQKTPG